MTAIATAADFDFSHLSDTQLRETFDIWSKDDGAQGAEWSELYRVGMEAIVEESHRRALGIKRREITISSFGRRENGWDGHSFLDNQVHVGTGAEFMEAFGLRLTDRPFAATGKAVGVDGNGYHITLEWFVS